MSALIKLIESLNGKEVFYDDNEIYYLDSEGETIVITHDADWYIENHFQGREIAVVHSSGDPALEKSKTVSGRKYIDHEFNGDYVEALKNL